MLATVEASREAAEERTRKAEEEAKKKADEEAARKAKQTASQKTAETTKKASGSTEKALWEEALQELSANSLQLRNVRDFHYMPGSTLYRKVTGSVYNNGNTRYKFIEVRITWKDSDGKTVKTGSAYACGSEGIDPGESSSFECEIINEYNKIKSAEVSILSYR